MDKNSVPYIVYEGAQAKNERTVKRLVIALIVAVGLIFASNMAWLHYISNYDFVSESTVYTQDGQGTNIIGDSNEVDNGADTGKSDTEENPQEN